MTKLLISIFIISCILLIFIDKIKYPTVQLLLKLYIKLDLHLLIPYADNSNPTNQELISLLHPTNKLPQLSNYNLIPNKLFQIYMFYTKPVPQYIFDGIKNYASNYEYVLFDHTDAIPFLTKYFNKKIVKRFHDLKLGAHKADLLRYCYLYIYGGIYLDIKTILIKPLDDIFINKTYFYTSKSATKNILCNSLIGTKPRNLIFLKLINYIINIPLHIINFPMRIYYLTFCQDLYNKIQNDLSNSTISLQTELNIGKNQNYYLFDEKIFFNKTEECPQLTKYYFNTLIYDKNQKIFIGRDPNHPW